MPLINAQLLHQVRKVIQAHHAAFVANVFGQDALPPEVVEDLKLRGLLQPSATPADAAYLYGQVRAALEDPKVQEWSLDKVQEWQAKNPIPLTPVEREAAKTARLTAAAYCQGLGNTVEKETGQLLIEADHALREELQEKIQDATSLNIAARETVKKLKSDLGWATGDWSRNLDRIAITEKHNAMELGVADGIRRTFGGEALVAIISAPDACASCKRFSLGPDGAPRVYRLSQLAPPGANVKRKQADWVACLGAMHPHCGCRVVRVPAGWGFNAEGDLVPGGQFGVRAPENLLKALAAEDEHWEALRKAYKLAGTLEFQGLPISIEQDKGDVREWKDRNGETGKTTFKFPYGYIRGTEGVDGDHVDVYVGPDPAATQVFIIHQRRKTKGGEFSGYDEDKCMLGFNSAAEAKRAYLDHYNDPGFFGGMTVMPMAQFKKQLPERRGKALVGEVPADATARMEAFVEGLDAVEKSVRFTLDVDWAKADILNPGATSPVVGTVIQADPGPSTGAGVNIQAQLPPRPVGGQPDVGGLRAWLLSGQPRTSVLKRPREVYEFDQDNPDAIFPINLDTGSMAAAHDPPNDTMTGRKILERQALAVSLVPRNVANPGWNPMGSVRLQDQPDLPPVQDNPGVRGEDDPAYLAQFDPEPDPRDKDFAKAVPPRRAWMGG